MTITNKYHRKAGRNRSAFSVPKLKMNFIMARTAERHEVASIVCAAPADRYDVMNLIHQSDAAFPVAHLTERMLRSIPISDPFPGTAVLPVHIGRPCIFVVLAVYCFSVFFAVLSVCEPGTSRVGAGAFRLFRHFLILFPVSFAIYRKTYQHCSR